MSSSVAGASRDTEEGSEGQREVRAREVRARGPEGSEGQREESQREVRARGKRASGE
jgi:hypothetical protein